MTDIDKRPAAGPIDGLSPEELAAENVAALPDKEVVSILDLDVDYLSFSAHKIGGPQGVGAFYVKPGAPFRAGGGNRLQR